MKVSKEEHDVKHVGHRYNFTLFYIRITFYNNYDKKEKYLVINISVLFIYSILSFINSTSSFSRNTTRV